jgi:EAL domain-containing protein (putative c-di-GMP-specific phosphodiesterase class I)
MLDGTGTPLGSLVDGSSVAEAAERSGLAVSVGAGLLDTACAQAAAAPDAGPVWVPLSARQVRQSRLAALVASTLDRHGLEPGMLLVEVAEDVVASDDNQVWRTVADLRAVGVGLGLSGFGSGGANPAVVRRAAPQVVVLDTAWGGALGTDDGEPEVVAGLIALGRALGARSAAEAVGRPEQAAALLEAGCELASGALWPASVPQSVRMAPPRRLGQSPGDAPVKAGGRPTG